MSPLQDSIAGAATTHDLHLPLKLGVCSIDRRRPRWPSLQVHEAVLSGGKVLVPVFAVGRAQEMLILLDGFWERMNMQVKAD